MKLGMGDGAHRDECHVERSHPVVASPRQRRYLWHECQQPEQVRALVEALRANGTSVLTGCHLHAAGDER